MTKKDEINLVLINIMKHKMEIDLPVNFDEISEYVYNDICETADEDNWNDSDVLIAFRRWIESKVST